jgi:uncharacterized protein (TIGR03905 family)
MNTYNTKGTCSRQILYDITPEGTVSNVKFIGGCLGNLQAVSRLVEGKTIDEVIFLLKGIQCRAGTSCADQLARALEQYQETHPEVQG